MIIEPVRETYSPLKNKIELFRAGPQSSKNSTALVIGVFHGDEWQGENLILNLMDCTKSTPELINNNEIYFIPCLNPDGRDKKTRVNFNEVDLNRNFPTENWIETEKNEYYSGPSAASEIETRFLIDIINETNPDRILTIHSPYRCVNYDGPAREIAKELSKLNFYPVMPYIGYPTPGSFGTYCGIERNIPTITLELPEQGQPDKLWERNKEALKYFISI